MIVSLDIETEFGAGDNTTPPLACVQIGDKNGARIYHWSEAHGRVRDLLRNPDAVIYGAEIAYDMACIMAFWPDLTPDIFRAYDDNRVEDMLLNQKLIDIAEGNPTDRSYSLQAVARRQLGVSLDKENPWRKNFGELRVRALSEWPELALNYALEDARVEYDIARKMNMLLFNDRHRQARASFWLRLASNRGLTVDQGRLRLFAQDLRRRKVVLAARLTEVGLIRKGKGHGQLSLLDGGMVENYIRNEAKARNRFAKICAADVPWTESGPGLSAEYLLNCGDPELEAYAQYSQILKKLSNDVPALSVPHRLHTHFDSLKVTGRTGSADPNLQNFDVASGIRECIVPAPGYLFADADYGKMECCAWSQVCIWLFGQSKMAGVLNSGGDPHANVAAQILGCSLEEAADAYYERQCGKVVNYGCAGGMGPKRLVNYAFTQYGVRITESEARQLRFAWRRTWAPCPDLYFQHVNDIPGDRKTVVSFKSNRVRGNCSYTEACNNYFQSLAADAGKDAGWHLTKACYLDRSSVLYGSYVVNYPHDQFITETPVEVASEAADEQARIMEQVAREWMPDVPPKADPLLADRWSKNNKPKRDSNGRLYV